MAFKEENGPFLRESLPPLYMSTVSGTAPAINAGIHNDAQNSIDHYGQWEDTAYRLREYANDAPG
ncbi:MAG: hypothetical protein IPK73_31135 [Candidatus Obscuribacter sp.]|nr:hypothetical protein [Candidatus Obscuribacter sp.]